MQRRPSRSSLVSAALEPFPEVDGLRHLLRRTLMQDPSFDPKGGRGASAYRGRDSEAKKGIALV